MDAMKMLLFCMGQCFPYKWKNNINNPQINFDRRKSTPIDARSTLNRRPVASGWSRLPPNIDLRRFNPEMGWFNVEHEVDMNQCKSMITRFIATSVDQNVDY